jgi:peptide/nickel transport system permease protein
VFGYIARRLVQLVIVLIGVSIITFLIMFLIPGDPAYLLAGKNATPERVAEVRVELGLNKPVYIQYARFVDRLVHGNFGESYQFERPVRGMLTAAIPNTAQLAFAAILIELLGVPLGVYSALRQYTIWDTAMTTTALVIWGIPVFVLAVFLQYVFGVYLHVLPFFQTGGSRFLWVIPTDWDNLSHLILPAVTLGIIEVAYISYMQRASMLEVIRSDYVRTARAKGLPERSVILKHSLKNALIPVMTIAGIDLGALLGGAILTETVFSRPGVGLMVYNAIIARDLPVVVAGVLFATLVYVIANLVVDIAYAYVDPRIRYE